MRIDHLHIAAPLRSEAGGRGFYGGILGMAEIAKPPELRKRGGCWFACGGQQLHIGVEEDFRAAKRAHPAFAVESLEALRLALVQRGFPAIDDENLPGSRRFSSEDPWGNRLEFVEQRND